MLTYFLLCLTLLSNVLADFQQEGIYAPSDRVFATMYIRITKSVSDAVKPVSTSLDEASRDSSTYYISDITATATDSRLSSSSSETTSTSTHAAENGANDLSVHYAALGAAAFAYLLL